MFSFGVQEKDKPPNKERKNDRHVPNRQSCCFADWSRLDGCLGDRVIVVTLATFAVVIWVQHRNHQADYRALIAMAVLMAEREES